MRLITLLQYLHDHTGETLLVGSPEETLTHVAGLGHPDTLCGEIITRLAQSAPDGIIDRAAATNALGDLRLRYMKDDAPVEGFRLTEKIVHAIDGAFNEEALANRS